MSGRRPGRVRRLQKRFKFLKNELPMILSLLEGDNESFRKAAGSRAAVLARKVRRACLELKEGLLLCNGKRLVCSDDGDLTEDIVRGAHVAVGHGCWEKTFERVCKSYVGVSSRIVQEFVRACRTCQEFNRTKTRGKKKAFGVLAVPATPWNHVQMDLVDLRSYREANYGWSWILTAIDRFSRFAAAEPMMNKSAAECKGAVWGIFSRYGVPAVWQTDNGSEFVNGIVEELMRDLHVEIRHGRPYKPTSQGCVERWNQVLVSMIGKLGAEDSGRCRGRWLDLLDTTVFRYNCRVHRAVKMSPFSIMFGREGFSQEARKVFEEDASGDDSAASLEWQGGSVPDIREFDQRRKELIGKAGTEEARYSERRNAEDGVTKVSALGIGEGDVVLERTSGTDQYQKSRKFEPRYHRLGRVVDVDEERRLIEVADEVGERTWVGAAATKVVQENRVKVIHSIMF